MPMLQFYICLTIHVYQVRNSDFTFYNVTSKSTIFIDFFNVEFYVLWRVLLFRLMIDASLHSNMQKNTQIEQQKIFFRKEIVN